MAEAIGGAFARVGKWFAAQAAAIRAGRESCAPGNAKAQPLLPHQPEDCRSNDEQENDEQENNEQENNE
jgi:hypothetical protein